MSKHNQKPIRWWNASGGSKWWDALADLAEAERKHRAALFPPGPDRKDI